MAGLIKQTILEYPLVWIDIPSNKSKKISKSIYFFIIKIVFLFFVKYTMMVFGSVIVASTINYFTLIAFFPITALFIYLRVVFLKTSRELKRIE
jgi:hypothetical protein